MINQIKKELTQAMTKQNMFLYLSIILLIPCIQFALVYDSYQFFTPEEVFEESVSILPAMLFPVLAILVYIPSFISEYKNNFLTYTRTRVHLKDYLMAKGIVNALLSGVVLFLMIFITYLFVRFIEPLVGLVQYTPISESTIEPSNTFSFLIGYSPLLYALIYALWVGLNAALYSTLAYFLILSINNIFVAISIPFVGYHVFNFVTGILQMPQFSPLSTIFPFNITAQPIWTIFIPFLILLLVNFIIYKVILQTKKEWVFN